MSIVDNIIEAFLGTPSNQRINRDIREIELELKDYRNRLIPVTDPELRDLSDHQLDYRKTRSIKKNNLALIGTVFDEPALCYGVKQYRKNKRDGIVLAMDKNHSFVVRFREKSTQLFVNDKFFGILNNNGQISKGRASKVLASIDTRGSMRTVKVLGESVASFNYEHSNSPKVRKRVLHYANPRNEIDRFVIMLYFVLSLIKKYEL